MAPALSVSRQLPWYPFIRHSNSSVTQTGPPEVHLSEDVVYQATAAMDRWAAACILVEAAVWVNGGKKGRQQFSQRRRDEIADVAPGLINLGRGDCFHKNTGPLSCVKQVTQAFADTNSMSAKIVDVVLARVLKCKPEDRLGAGNLMAKLERRVEGGEKRAEPERPPRQLPVPSADLPFISIDDVEKWRHEKKCSGKDKLKGKNAAFPQLRGRDHVSHPLPPSPFFSSPLGVQPP